MRFGIRPNENKGNRKTDSLMREGTFKHFIYQQGYLLITSAWLFTLSFVIGNYWSYTSSERAVTRSLESYINVNERKVEELSADRTLLARLYSGAYSPKDLKEAKDEPYFVFLYPIFSPNATQPVFWNTNVVVPDQRILAGRYGSSFVELPNGRYISIKREIIFTDGHTALMIALIPVQWKLKLNAPQENTFMGKPGIERNYQISLTPNDNAVTSADGTVLFYLDKQPGLGMPGHSPVALIMRIAGILFLLFFIHSFALWIARRRGRIWGILSLVTIVVLGRWLTYLLATPFDFRQFEIFDPSIYSSGPFLRSLGDVLINTLLFFWLAVFALDHLSYRVNERILKDKYMKWGMAVLVAMIILFATLASGNTIRSLVADSQISFNVTDFFSILNVYSLYGFICFCGIALGYFVTIQILYRYYVILTGGRKDVQFLILTLLGLLLLSLRIIERTVSYELLLLIWLLLFIMLLGNARKWHMAEGLGAGNIIFWLFFFSASMAMLIIRQNNQKELLQRRIYAEKLSLKADPYSEADLDMSLDNLNAGFLYQDFSRLSDPEGSQFFKDSLINEVFSVYRNKYEARIYTYDVFDKPINNPDSSSYTTLNNIYTVLSSPTGVTDLLYYREAFDKFTYIVRRVVEDSSHRSRLGYVFLLARPKKFESEAFYPQLIKTSADEGFSNSPEYAYAIYDNLELIKNNNEYPFAIHLTEKDVPITEYDIRLHKGYEELWYKTTGGKIVVVVRKAQYFIEAITLFAYLFCLFLILSGTMQLTGFMIRARFRWSNVRELWEVNIRTQVHLTITFISLFSFVIIGVSTFVFLRDRYDHNNQDKLSKTIQIMVSEVQDEVGSGIFNGTLPQDTTGNLKMDETLGKVADVHGVAVNLYDPRGTLRYTSQPYYYSRGLGLLSEKMDPLAYYELVHEHQVQLIQDEKIGPTTFMSIYVPVRDDNGKAYAFLNIPYFATQDELNLEISNFLVTLINLNAFIFVVAGMIALLITNRITDSFSLIGEKMKAIKLGRQNEEIVWHRNNELGELVKEYNKMVRQLEQSANLLAKSEREGAWREMARQVAHEIKNPLTPMKLSIQYLLRAINNNHPNAKALSANVAKTLIEQIDYLSNIATDFSSFANIAHPKKDRVDLVEALESVVKLFSMDTSMRLLFEKTASPVYVLADKTHLNRLFTNLIRNAMDAIPEDAPGGVVQLRYMLQDSPRQVTVIVQDNGTGIPEELRDKIFIPNFTTKSSGTGLGLAMCKGIAEQMSGTIWFDTEMGEGTTFYVEIPVLD
jgi:two-component system, NtrC family, nitrogen regulation sensor histidine kinase NtrY